MPRASRRSFLQQAGALTLLAMAEAVPFGRAPTAAVSPAAPSTIGAAPPAMAVLRELPVSSASAQSVPLPAPYQLQTIRHALLMDLEGTAYETRFRELTGQGYRVLTVQGGPNGGGSGPATFSAIFVRNQPVQTLYSWTAMDKDLYQSRFNQYFSQGLVPVSVSGYDDGGQVRYAATWVTNPGWTDLLGIHDATPDAYQAFVNQVKDQGYSPWAVDGFLAGSDARYISVWVKPDAGAWEARHGLSADEYQAFFKEFSDKGYYVRSLSAYPANVDGTIVTRFAAMMVQRSVGEWYGRHNLPAETLFSQAVTWAQTDFQPTVIESYEDQGSRKFGGVWIKRSRSWVTTGQAESTLAGFDDLIQDYMQKRAITSGAFALTRKSKLIYARGYSWDYDRADAVTPTTLFRIASLTKPITSLAAMVLVQKKRLGLSGLLVNLLNLQPQAGWTADSRLPHITVRFLLQHLGGWDSDKAKYDPMVSFDESIARTLGVSLPISQQNIMTFMTGQPLEWDPGTHYAYSNYGYMLLGRIIERISGLSYATHVQQAVLNPLYISRMRLGRTELEQRSAGELEYATLDVGLAPNVRRAGAPKNAMPPYGAFNLENMDSHGGWLATAVDLARFTTAFDSTSNYPVVTPKLVDMIFAQPVTGPQADGTWYGLGWQVKPAGTGINTWHTGRLLGTWTLMVRRNDGLNWVALFNRWEDRTDLPYEDIDSALHGVADSVSTWPKRDLFPGYGLPTPG